MNKSAVVLTETLAPELPESWAQALNDPLVIRLLADDAFRILKGPDLDLKDFEWLVLWNAPLGAQELEHLAVAAQQFPHLKILLVSTPGADAEFWNLIEPLGVRRIDIGPEDTESSIHGRLKMMVSGESYLSASRI